jgi:hypothetical protein
MFIAQMQSELFFRMESQCRIDVRPLDWILVELLFGRVGIWSSCRLVHLSFGRVGFGRPVCSRVVGGRVVGLPLRTGQPIYQY